ncbi:MAG TPA: hypothetical protein VGB17_19410 [Pyrinomonadaceae bacterium]|jgi:hypothetical protein
MDATYTTPPEIGRIQRPALIVGLLLLVLCLAGAFVENRMGRHGLQQFFRSYLLGFIFWIGIALGSLGLLMLQHMTGGAWGMVIRRVLEACTRTLPLMLVLFLPFLIFTVIINVGHVYEWVHPESELIKRAVEAKHGYLRPWFFVLRAIIYFAVWLALMYLLNLWSREQDRTADRKLSPRMRKLSAPGIILFVLTVTFASVDWVMSLDPEWFSTIFGLLFVAAWTLTAFSFVIMMMALLTARSPLAGVVQPRHFHDLGKLLLAFVMLWAYFAFSQYLIIWSGNLPEETKWYLYRERGGWGWVGIIIVILHFALPFLLLLSRDLKRNGRLLARVALVIFIIRFVDLFWLIVPVFHHNQLSLSWMDIVAPVGIGGLWLAFFAWQLKQRPLLPLNDPNLESALEHTAGH